MDDYSEEKRKDYTHCFVPYYPMHHWFRLWHSLFTQMNNSYKDDNWFRFE